MSDEAIDTIATKKRVPSNAIAARLKATYGNIAIVAKEFGLERTALHHRIAREPNLVTALEDARETIVDHAESELIKAAQKGADWAILRIIKSSRASRRGWSERQEVEHSGNSDKPITFKVVQTSDLRRTIADTADAAE